MTRTTRKSSLKGLTALLLVGTIVAPFTVGVAPTHAEEVQEPLKSLNWNVEKDGDTIKISIVDTLDDLVNNLGQVVIKDDGVYGIVNDKEYIISKETLDFDYDNARALRHDNNKISTVKHYTSNDSLILTTRSLENIVISSRLDLPFEDVVKTNAYYKDINDLYNYGITNGTSPTTYNPDSLITRGQFAVMVSNALELSDNTRHWHYTLTDLQDKWYANNVQSLYDLDIFTGDNDRFNGEEPITRQQAVTVLVRALGELGVNTATTYNPQFLDDMYVQDYAKQSTYFLAEQGIINTGLKGEFYPHEKITRGETANLIMKTLKLSDNY